MDNSEPFFYQFHNQNMVCIANTRFLASFTSRKFNDQEWTAIKENSERNYNRFISRKLIYMTRIRSIDWFLFLESFWSRMEEKTKLGHSETISTQFLQPDLKYRVKVPFISLPLVSDSSSSRKTNHQELMRKLSKSILKPFSIDLSTQNLFNKLNVIDCIIFFLGLSSIKRDRWSRLEAITGSEHFWTSSYRFFDQKLVDEKKIISCWSFSVSDSFWLSCNSNRWSKTEKNMP